MAKTKPGCRVVLQLDPRIALEAIILNRLERIPTSRRQEWLRGLLVQGFRSECQAVRGAPEETKRSQVKAFNNWLAGESQRSATPNVKSPAVRVASHDAKTEGKPFATLSKVIGSGSAAC